MASVYKWFPFYQVVSFYKPYTKLVINDLFQINTLYAGLLINIFYVYDLLAF